MNTSLALLAALSTDDMINTVVQLIVVGAIVWILLWAAQYLGIPEPFAKIIKVVIVLFAVVWLARLLLNLI